jgi:hypothetical protein
MRVTLLEITRWRNFEDVEIALDGDASLICLVGENGTGKSNLLELLDFAAEAWGLTPQSTVKRPFPAGRFHPHRVRVRLALDSQSRAWIDEGLAPSHLAQWDGTLDFEATATPHRGAWGESFVVVRNDADGISGWRVLAGGFAAELEASNIASLVTSRLKSFNAVTHLYVHADRTFGPFGFDDSQVFAAAREDQNRAEWLRQQAAVRTEDAYAEWIRAMLGQQHRLAITHYEDDLDAVRAGRERPTPGDPLQSYREGLAAVLPHLRFDRLDNETRQLLFDVGAQTLPYHELSAGERELAFLVGQLDRFPIGQGLFLLDEPELHLNADLVRTWLEYLRRSVRGSQAWIATHSLDAVEVVGSDATLLIERSSDRVVRSIAPLRDRPVIEALAGAVGSPAFSVARNRFILIEGERPKGERERFRAVLGSSSSDRFVESGGCQQVLAKHSLLSALASEEEQLRIGAIIDRDFRSDADITALVGSGICVLPVHEIENFFLHPATLYALAQQARQTPEQADELLRSAADSVAGQWILERTAAGRAWNEIPGVAIGHAKGLSWASIKPDFKAGLQRLAELLSSDDRDEVVRHRAALMTSARAYDALRSKTEEFWKACLGKEALARVAAGLGLIGPEAYEQRALALWTSGLPRPEETQEVIAYIRAIRVVR